MNRNKDCVERLLRDTRESFEFLFPEIPRRELKEKVMKRQNLKKSI